MGRYSGILLCSDLDGTLYNGKLIPENNIKAIKHFCANGGCFSPASGRPLRFLKEMFADIGFSSPVIALNGAHICDFEKGVDIKKTFMSGVTRELLMNIIGENSEIYRVNLHTKYGCLKVLPDDLKNVDVDFDNDIFKVTFNLESVKETSDAVKARIRKIAPDSFDLLRSSYGCIELIDPRNTKDKAARLIADYVGADKLVCVGDFENDITMVCNADVGYAVANAIDALKAVADRVTVSVDDGAIAAIIEEL